MFSFSLTTAIACRLHRLMRRPDEKEWKWMLKICVYRTVAVVHFIDQNWIPKTVYCIKCVLVCKISFTNWTGKITLLRAFMVVTYYIKLFWTGADRHNVISMSLLLLVAETINIYTFHCHKLKSTDVWKMWFIK